MQEKNKGRKKKKKHLSFSRISAKNLEKNLYPKTARSMSSKIKSWDQFDYKSVVYKDPVKNNMGGMNAYIDTSSSDASNPKFQLPRSRIPFGLDKNEKSESTRYNLEISLDNPKFVEWIQSFDDQTMTHASKHSETWFGKKIEKNIMEQMEIFRLSAQAKNPKYNPLMRLKVATQGAKIPKVFVQKEVDGKTKYVPGDLTDVVKGSWCTPIVDVSGIWMISKKGFGVTYLVSHILVEKPDDEANPFPFVGVSMEEEDSNPYGQPSPKRQKTDEVE